MSGAELDELFGRSPAGEIPDGEANGQVLIGTENDTVSDTAAKVAHLVAWQGKVFDREKGELKNKIGPLGLKAIRAQGLQGAELVRREGDDRPRLLGHLARRALDSRRDPRGLAPPLPGARLLGARQDPPLLAPVRPVTSAAASRDAVPARADDRRARRPGRRRRSQGPARHDGRRSRQRLGPRLRRALGRPFRPPDRRRRGPRQHRRAPPGEPGSPERLRRLGGDASRRARGHGRERHRPALRSLRGLPHRRADAAGPAGVPDEPPCEGGGEVRQHHRSHGPADPAGGRASRCDPGLSRPDPS